MSRGSKLRWLWRAPARALGRARDMYVRGVTGCARYVPADAAFGYPVIVPASLSRSCSGGAGSSFGFADPAEEDLRQLVRAASQRRVEAMMQQAAAAEAVATAARSRSMAMARIDEDAPCEFGDGGAGALYVRSQSCVGVGGGEAAAMRRARGHRKVVALG